jgi:DNA-binding LytR/AlgR family response regulator
MKSTLDSTILSLNEVIFVSNKNRYERILKKDILYIEAQGAYVDIYVHDGKKNLSTHLKSFLSQLGDTTFIQVSRKHAVNILHIDGFTSTDLKIKDSTIAISKSYRSQLLEKLPIIKTKTISV